MAGALFLCGGAWIKSLTFILFDRGHDRVAGILGEFERWVSAGGSKQVGFKVLVKP